MFDSETAEQEKLRNKNGAFRSSNGTIWVDINAEQGLLGALSHELTHMVELLDNKTYTQIAEILADKYGEKLFKDKGLGIEDMVSAYQRIYEEKGQALTPKEAYSEFAADCMTQMLADTNAIETIAKLRRVMDEPTQNKFISKIRKAISEIRNYLRNISSSEKNLVKDISAVTMQLDCLQNIADLWAKGVANSMNEFERLTKSENADKSNTADIEADNGQIYNSKKYAKPIFPHGHFPNVTANKGSNAHEEAIRWANNSKVSVGDWKLATYNDKWYIIEKYDTLDLNYQVTEKVSKKQYEFFRKEWIKQYGNQETVARISNEISSVNRQTTEYERGRPNLDDDVFEYSKEDNFVQRMGAESLEKGKSQFNSGSSSFSGNENRQGNGAFGLDKKSNSEKFSIKTTRDEFRTNAMIWANSADTKVGDTKILFGGGKGFALLEATENGYIEIARGDYDVVKGAKDYYERTNRAGEILDRYAESLETERRRNNWHFSAFENTSNERRAIGLDSFESNNDKAGINEQNRRDSEKFSIKSIPNNRVLLSNALETVTQNDIERKYIRDYKAHINLLNEQEAKLKKINEEIGALSFAHGKRDTARLKELTEERIKTQNRINIYDKKLLRLEATKPLQNVINAEVSKFKNKLAAERQNEIESRYKTGKRHQIRQNFDYLSSLLISPKKQRNIGKMQH